MDADLLFPSGFLWGSATSAWQVEGGRLNNEYDLMYRQGRIAGGADPAETAGFWERYPEDIASLQRVRHTSFRMSVEWARVEPEAGGSDRQALDHYRDILIALRTAGIVPVVDLQHHSSPLWLHAHGGWASRRAIGFVCRYAREVVGRLGDLVGVWLTINEPTIGAAETHLTGDLPPYKHSLPQFLRCLDVLARAHVALYDAIHETHARKGWPRPTVGFAHAVHGVDPFREHNPLDRASAALVQQVLEDHFPETVLRRGRALDVLGINYYVCLKVRFPLDLRFRLDVPYTKEGWPIDPQGFRRVLLSNWEKYGLPLWVTENGVGEDDDGLRPRFLLDHLWQMHAALADGADILAYHHWSTMDTLEYQKGFEIKYGLMEVDRTSPNKPRRLRRSGQMYAEIAAANGITRAIVARYVPDWSSESFPQGYGRRYCAPGIGRWL